MEITLYTIIFWQIIANIVSFIVLGIIVVAFLRYRLKVNKNSLSLHPKRDSRRKIHKIFVVSKRKKDKQQKQVKSKVNKK